MREPSANLSVVANQAKEQTPATLRQSRNYLRSNADTILKLRKIFPVKTALYLHTITGYPVRTCEYWLSRERLPSEAVWALLHSEHGLELLVAGMANARPQWWTWLLRLGVAASAMRRRAADRRLIESTLDADRELSTAISRASMLSDEDFHRPFLDALGEARGPRNRAVAEREET